MISSKATTELQYYVGKICTIITRPINVPITEANHSQWFTIRVDAIDQEQIWGTDINRLTKSTFFFPIVSIVEEQVITEDNPKYSAIKETMENKLAVKPALVEKPATPCCASGISCKEKAAKMSMKDILQQASAIREQQKQE